MFKYGTYWVGTGQFQAEFKRLRTALVPVAGAAETADGELLRAVSTVYTDLKRHRLAHVGELWPQWHTVYAHRDAIVAAIGPAEGAWVFAVCDRCVTERYLAVRHGEGEESPRQLPDDAFERLIDGCVVALRGRHSDAA